MNRLTAGALIVGNVVGAGAILFFLSKSESADSKFYREIQIGAPATFRAFGSHEKRTKYIDSKCSDLYSQADEKFAMAECSRRIRVGLENLVQDSYGLTRAEWAQTFGDCMSKLSSEYLCNSPYIFELFVRKRFPKKISQAN